MIAGVDHAVKVRAFFLDSFEGTPENPFSAATVVGVRVEETHGSFSAPSAIEYERGKSQNETQKSRNQSPNDYTEFHRCDITDRTGVAENVLRPIVNTIDGGAQKSMVSSLIIRSKVVEFLSGTGEVDCRFPLFISS